MTHKNSLELDRTLLAIVDMQEAFRGAISDFSEVAEKIGLAVRSAQLLNLPAIVTEQYPKGLGHTAAEIRSVFPSTFEPLEKTTFSACGNPEFVARIRGYDRKQVLLCGIEAHICVNQTAHDLLALGFDVHLLSDCITARSPHNRTLGLKKMINSGAISGSLELAVFELMRDARHPRFKAVQDLIK